MNLAPILALLQKRTGLDPGTLGTHAVQIAIAQRLLALGLDAAGYAARLAEDAGEFSRLVGEVIVPETWFFRGGGLFFYLADQIRLAVSGRPMPYRVLSLPCSTGEEAYSLAIALAESGVPPSRYVIDGVDISARNIEAAQRGVYNDLAFRQMASDLRRRWFRPLARGGEIDSAVRANVRFQAGNLLDRGLLLWEKPYDLVFCRNLFIYFTPEARRQGLDTLARLVAPAGLLALGHAESLEPEENRFRRAGPEGYFLYRRAGVIPSAIVPGTISTESAIQAPTVKESAKAAREDEAPSLTVEPSRGHRSEAMLDEARRLADQGLYVEALDHCARVREQFGPSADLYTLLGIIHQARHDDDEADRCFNKALYLTPDHREAILHLMLLRQRDGALDRARLLRARLERLPPQGDDS